MARLSVCCFVCGGGIPVKSMVSGKITYFSDIVREGDFVRHRSCSSRPEYETRRKEVLDLARSPRPESPPPKRKIWVKA